MEQDIEHDIDVTVETVSLADLVTGSAIISLAVLMGVLLLRFFLIRFVKGKSEILQKEQRRWINRINNGSTITVFVILILVWAPQLHTFALSLTAVAVAIVITTKELLMCLSGGFLRTTAKSFDIGDMVKIDNDMGEVIRTTALVTSIQEVEGDQYGYQYTGRTIQIPNSKFLSHPIENANFLRTYHYLSIPLTIQYADINPAALLQKLQEITMTHYDPHRQAAATFIKKVERKSGIDFADPEPEFSIRTTELGHQIFTAKLFVPSSEAKKISTLITEDFLGFVYEQKQQKEEETQKAS